MLKLCLTITYGQILTFVTQKKTKTVHLHVHYMTPEIKTLNYRRIIKW